MNDKLNNIIKENLLKLPKEAQEVLNNFKWKEICEEIGKAHKLLEPEIEQLKAVTALLLLGLVDGEFYAKNIENKVELTQEDSEILAKEVFEKIFLPISKEITEKVKAKVKDGGQKWNQNIDFIVSGGDYSAFIDRREPTKTESNSEGKDKTINPIKKMEDLKKVADLKSKFTI